VTNKIIRNLFAIICGSFLKSKLHDKNLINKKIIHFKQNNSKVLSIVSIVSSKLIVNYLK